MLLVDGFSKSDCWAAPIVFGPRTLGRTWGTRPISCDSDCDIDFPVDFLCSSYDIDFPAGMGWWYPTSRKTSEMWPTRHLRFGESLEEVAATG